jgi:tRNA pseudouridine38-40 synthase
VQGVLEAALRKLDWTGDSVLLAGRTDAGVHAAGQVAAFDLDWRHTLEDLRNALNALLPEDIAVNGVYRKRADFHPRYDALSRTYQYQIYCQPVRNPIIDRYSWRVWPRPEINRLKEAARLFPGVHDYAGYGRPTREAGSTIRQLTSVEWMVSGNELIFEITGNAFLYHMVRRLVYAQVMVAQGKLDFEELSRQLNDPGDEPLQGLAPAKGLILVRVTYPGVSGESD